MRGEPGGFRRSEALLLRVNQLKDGVDIQVLMHSGVGSKIGRRELKQGGGRAGIFATYTADNQARAGLVVFEPGGGTYCRTAFGCRYLHRHEIGHALGFLGHSGNGLMQSGFDVLSDREVKMVRTLYSLPHGARLEVDGRWTVPASGEAGQIDDLQAAQDVLAWNVNAEGNRSARQPGIICRWELPVRVYLQ